MAQIFPPKCGTVARENLSWNNGAVVRWRKDLKSGTRHGGGGRELKKVERAQHGYTLQLGRWPLLPLQLWHKLSFFFIQDSEYFLGQCIGHSRAINFPLCAMCMTVDRRTQCTVERRTQCTVDRRTQCTVDRRTQSTAELGTRQFFSFATT